VDRWLRFNRYEIKGSYIRPAPDSRLIEYEPWEDFQKPQGKESLKQPYLSLLELAPLLQFDFSERRSMRLEAPGEERLLEWCSQYGLLGILLHRVETVTFPAETRFPRGLSGNVPVPVATRLERTNTGWRTLDIFPFLHPPKPGAYLRRKLGEYEITFESLSESWAHYFPGVSADDRDSYQYPPVFGPEFWRQYAEPVSEFVGGVKMFRKAVDALRNLGSRSRPSPEKMQELLRAEHVIHALSEPVRPMLYRTGSGYGLGWACHSLLGTFAMMAMLDLSGARLIECANPSCRSLFVSKAVKALYCTTSCRGTEQVRKYRNRKERARRLFGRGLSITEIAEKLRLDPKMVGSWIQKWQSEALATRSKMPVGK
jgi:hypothetical protein